MLKMAIKKINIKIFNNKIKIYPIHKQIFIRIALIEIIYISIWRIKNSQIIRII